MDTGLQGYSCTGKGAPAGPPLVWQLLSHRSGLPGNSDPGAARMPSGPKSHLDEHHRGMDQIRLAGRAGRPVRLRERGISDGFPRRGTGDRQRFRSAAEQFVAGASRHGAHHLPPAVRRISRLLRAATIARPRDSRPTPASSPCRRPAGWSIPPAVSSPPSTTWAASCSSTSTAATGAASNWFRRRPWPACISRIRPLRRQGTRLRPRLQRRWQPAKSVTWAPPGRCSGSISSIDSAGVLLTQVPWGDHHELIARLTGKIASFYTSK